MSKLSLIMQLLGPVTQAVIQLEQLFPGKNNGAVKKQLATDAVGQVADVTEAAAPVVSDLIDSVVATLNANDAWHKAQGVLPAVQMGVQMAGAVASTLKATRKR